MADHRQASRTSWATQNETATQEEINLGSLQRIADAVEKMACSYVSMEQDRDLYKRWYREEKDAAARLRLQNAALRGVITKLKGNNMSQMQIFCKVCRSWKPCEAGRYFQALRKGLPLYCGRDCAGIARRKIPEDCKTPKNPKWKLIKAAYDKNRRKEMAEEINVKKRAAYAVYGPANREKEKQVRAKRMHLHVEYCRTPEYRAKKKDYDRKHHAEKFYGEFADAAIVLFEVETEVNSRMDWYERHQANGLLNKSTQRKREYERITGSTKANGNQPQEFPLGNT